MCLNLPQVLGRQLENGFWDTSDQSQFGTELGVLQVYRRSLKIRILMPKVSTCN